MRWEDTECFRCGGTCCKVGYIVRVHPDEELYGDERYVHMIDGCDLGESFHHMKSNGDGYTCIALGSDNRCTIWERRPRACRLYEVDSPRCKSIKKEYNRP